MGVIKMAKGKSNTGLILGISALAIGVGGLILYSSKATTKDTTNNNNNNNTTDPIDSDGDDYSDEEELAYGSNPHDILDFPSEAIPTGYKLTVSDANAIRRFNESKGDFDKLDITGGGGPWHWASKNDMWYKRFERFQFSDRTFQLRNLFPNHFLLIERWDEKSKSSGTSIKDNADYDFTYIIPPSKIRGMYTNKKTMSIKGDVRLSLGGDVALAYIRVIHKNARWKQFSSIIQKRIRQSDDIYGTNWENMFASNEHWADFSVHGLGD